MLNYLPPKIAVFACTCAVLASAEYGRIRALFDAHEVFDEELLLATFQETATEEFLLTETEDLLDEFVAEFPDWLSKRHIGEETHEGRRLELVEFKPAATGFDETSPTASAVLIDGAHHSRELITIKMTLTILLRLLHGIHYGD